MLYFEQISDKITQIKVDTNIYNERVIIKSLYWLSEKYVLYQSLDDNIFTIKIETDKEYWTPSDVEDVKKKLCQNLIDFKTRDIINQETKNIRQILFIKAFANNDEFDEYNLISNE